MPELAPSGLAALDALTGGWPRGALSEVFGPASSGRATVLHAALAAASAREEACCLIDGGDTFDPESAAAAGVALNRVLWVRCGLAASSELRAASKRNGFARSAKLTARSSYPRIEQALKCADLVLQSGGFGLLIIDVAALPPVAARRVPLASWYRFRHAVENTRTVLLLLSPAPLAQSCAALVLGAKQSAISTQHSATTHIFPCHSERGDESAFPPHAQLLAHADWEFELVRSRYAERKPPQRAPASVAARAFTFAG